MRLRTSSRVVYVDENQSREVAWSVLAHNLWVIDRLLQAHVKAITKASCKQYRTDETYRPEASL